MNVCKLFLLLCGAVVLFLLTGCASLPYQYGENCSDAVSIPLLPGEEQISRSNPNPVLDASPCTKQHTPRISPGGNTRVPTHLPTWCRSSIFIRKRRPRATRWAICVLTSSRPTKKRATIRFIRPTVRTSAQMSQTGLPFPGITLPWPPASSPATSSAVSAPLPCPKQKHRLCRQKRVLDKPDRS